MADSPEDFMASVYRFALRMTGSRDDAEDVAQETLLRGWRGRGRVRDPRALRVWLFRIAENLWRDRLRRAAPPGGREVPLDDVPDLAADPPGSGPEGDEAVDLLLRAIDRLPARQREVLHLHAFEGLSNGEIAEVLGIDEGAVRASLCVARKALRARLDRHPADGGG